MIKRGCIGPEEASQKHASTLELAKPSEMFQEARNVELDVVSMRPLNTLFIFF